MTHESTNDPRVEIQRAAYLTFMEYVRENCVDNPPYAQGASLAIEAHRVRQEMSRVLQNRARRLEDPAISERGSITLEAEQAAINAQYYSLRHNPETIRGWGEATAECRRLDSKIAFDFLPGQPQSTLFEMAILGEEYAAIGPSF